MENIDQNKDHNKDHNCTSGHCCSCDGCGNICKREGGNKKYWTKHILILIFGVVLAFWVGLNLGVTKGKIMSGNTDVVSWRE